jgi:hypothetical protein
MALTFDDASGRFRDSAGRFVSEQAVRRVVDQVADAASERMAQAAGRLLGGSLSLAEFQAEMMRTAKLAHVATATIAHGGKARMGFSEYGAVGREIRSQYEFLRTFTDQVASGEQPLNGGLTARARQYGQASRVTFEREYGRDQQRRGYQSCRNVLHAGESCSGCKAQTARGWVAIGSLIPVGSRTCRGNCRCEIRYRREPAEVAA